MLKKEPYLELCLYVDSEGLIRDHRYKYLGPVVQSIVSLTSSLVVKMLTVLVSKMSNSQVFLLRKCE